MEIVEEYIRFIFPEGMCVLKFDDESFYRNKYNKITEAKGVDFLLRQESVAALMEVKDFSWHERENSWRLVLNDGWRKKHPDDERCLGRNSLDIEVSKKVVSTLACLYGSWTMHDKDDSASKLGTFFKKSQVCSLKIILFLELAAGSSIQTRSNRTIRRNLRDSIEQKLSWLNCKVEVIDSHEGIASRFKIEKLKRPDVCTPRH